MGISDLLYELQSVTHTVDVLMYMYERLSSKKRELMEKARLEFDNPEEYVEACSEIKKNPVEFNQTDLLGDGFNLCSSNTIQDVLRNAIDCGCVEVRVTYVKQKVLKYRLTPKGCDVCHLLESIDMYEAVKVFDERWRSVSDDRWILGLLKEYNSGFPINLNEISKSDYNGIYLKKLCEGICNNIIHEIVLNNKDKFIKYLADYLRNAGVLENYLSKGIYIENASLLDDKSHIKWDLGQTYVLVKTLIRAYEIELLNMCVDFANKKYLEARGYVTPPVQSKLISPSCDPIYLKLHSLPCEYVNSVTVPLDPHRDFKLQVLPNGESRNQAFCRLEQNADRFKEICFLGKNMYLIGRYICPPLDFIVGQRKLKPLTYVPLSEATDLEKDSEKAKTKVGVSYANMYKYGVSDLTQLPVMYDYNKKANELVLKTLGGEVSLRKIKCDEQAETSIYDKFEFDIDKNDDCAYSYLKDKFVYKLWV